ncbi:T9SS type A sorting domain-containing protein [Flavisolibacter ginsenosidimutans]|uniref:T9SS type A sorting domain-containing protein n=1 Tax=Flavisolibacter ginsenosidimutans TaxID=661481 RepID=A0A5B8UE01_9BACT|nr:T9SS type A sorting domain-containing protein [Flavisolibacter ginsenosidimutans]QEC54575.1 T9SS type A sorting domain-containing protein [Flavisolibacter ginsenosidimutans]
MRIVLLFIALLPSAFLCAQAKLVINGGIVIINSGGVLVVNNPDNTAIIQTGSGYIQSEGYNNRLIWTIGTGNGANYLVPFGNAVTYLPVRFTAASGSDAAGQLVFSTYPTSTWKNSDFLPPGVTNMNNGSADVSANTIDRFWQVSPMGYTTKPTLTNLSFTYADGEYAPPNTVIESALIAERWNSSLNKWDDYIPPSSINTSTNTVTVASIAGNQSFNWWTLVSSSSPLPLTLTSFTASVQNRKVQTTWQTASEINTDHFEVWRSPNAVQFDLVGKVAAAGSSARILNYSLTDAVPYNHTSYYRLKSVDKDAKFSWSPTISVNITGETTIFLYPNPVVNSITLCSPAEVLNQKPVALLFDASGRLLQSFALVSPSQSVNTARLAAGGYRITIHYANETTTLSFIKK